MLDLITRYREQLAIWTAAPCTDDETDDALAQATYDPLYNRLLDAPPAIASAEGAVAALKLASEDQLQCSPMALAMVSAVLAYLEGEGLTMGQRALPPFKGYRDALEQLEGVIFRAVNFARLQRTLAETHDEPGAPEFRAMIVEAMSFIADETFRAVDEIEDLWLHLHNSAPNVVGEEV